MKKIIITIDGYSSCGKSTLAKQLAQKLHYIFIDSGAMYRAITLYFIQHDIDANDDAAVSDALKNISLSFNYDVEKGINDVLLNSKNVSAQIRDMRVNELVSTVAANKEVREFCVLQQQQIGINKGLVMDGRDIGTTVFPNAELKIFMTADIAVRVARRYEELYITNPDITIEEVKANLELRDYMDTNREISPLRKADDAIVLDNTNLTPEQQLQKALHWVKEKTLI